MRTIGESDREGRELAPPELQRAFERHPALARAFVTLSPAHRREYVRWIEEAKRSETRAKRATEAAQMILAKWKP